MSSYPHSINLSTQLRDFLEELPSFAAQIVNEHRTTVGGQLLLKVRRRGHDLELDGTVPVVKVYGYDMEPNPEYLAKIYEHRFMVHAAIKREQDCLI